MTTGGDDDKIFGKNPAQNLMAASKGRPFCTIPIRKRSQKTLMRSAAGVSKTQAADESLRQHS
jgi:hypothetical protein